MTRAEYMNGNHGDRAEGKRLHRAYYAQFVTREILGRVAHVIGEARILASVNRDDAFNDIPLRRWDAIPIPHGTDAALRAQGDYLTAAGWVCIAKEAAKQIREKGGL